MASLDWSQCPVVESIPGKVGTFATFGFNSLQRLKRGLATISSQVRAAKGPLRPLGRGQSRLKP
jgi:hypothetical protein